MSHTPPYDKLEDLPSLKKGWVRLAHRCIYKDHADSIKKNGLVFNRDAARLSPLQRGCSYPDITSMASVYDEPSFWDSLCKDDFSCYDNARFADTKIIFDLPLDEFSLLETSGQKIKGVVDSKYIVGCIPNFNGANPKLNLSVAEVRKAERISRNNPPSSAVPNNVDALIEDFANKSNQKTEMKNIILRRMKRCQDDLDFDLATRQKPKLNLLKTINSLKSR